MIKEVPPKNQPGKTLPSKSNGNGFTLFVIITVIIILFFIAAPIGISYYGVICRVFTATVIGVKMSLHVFGH